MTNSKRVVKGWALTKNGICESISNTGSAVKDYWTFMIYPTKEDALLAQNENMVPEWIIQKVSISLPTKRKKNNKVK